MAQQNHNATYLTVVDGLTVWERLRNIRNFLQDRKLALVVNENRLNKSNAPSDIIEELEHTQAIELLEDCKSEVKFLEELEYKLAIEAEKTRIEGKSDREMYEINYYEELIQIHTLQAQSEMMSVGHVTPDTMKTLLRNPASLDRCISIGLLSTEVRQLAYVNKAPALKAIESFNLPLLGGVTDVEMAID